MTRASVISVDPGKSTLGDLNPAATARALRFQVLSREADSAISFNRVLNSVFAVGNVSRVPSKGVSLLFVRMLAGLVFLFAGLSLGFGNEVSSASVLASGGFVPSGASMMLLVAGVSLCLGFFTRIIMTVSAICFAVLFGESLAAGSFQQTDAFVAALSLMASVVGAGRLSLDAMMRKALHSVYRRRARRIAERRLSYEAFRYEQF